MRQRQRTGQRDVIGVGWVFGTENDSGMQAVKV
jgi:hypothetical protein